MSKDVIPKKSLGQHWLNDEISLANMLVAADVGADDTILEIGPGLGSLTQLLVNASKEVIAVEFDDDLAWSLPIRVKAKNLHIVREDILRFDLTTLLPGYKVVANIPYYLTSKLVRVLSESTNPPAQVALLIQKEVAERLAAKPGDLSILGITSQYYWEVSLGPVVAAELFTPPPKVDSQIVKMKRRQTTLFPDVDESAFFHLVKAGFGAKRKTLLNSLSAGLRIEKSVITEMLAAASIDPGLRAQNLSLEEWHTLYTSYSRYQFTNSNK